MKKLVESLPRVGEEASLRSQALERGLNPWTVRMRIKRGWSVERALSTAVESKKANSQKGVPCAVCGCEYRYIKSGECVLRRRHAELRDKPRQRRIPPVYLSGEDVRLAAELIDKYGLTVAEVAEKFDVTPGVIDARLRKLDRSINNQ